MVRSSPNTRQSASSKAGLIFPVTRFQKKLKKIPQSVSRVSKTAGVYIASVIEYLISMIAVHNRVNSYRHSFFKKIIFLIS
jgi:hypothetical protein